MYKCGNDKSAVLAKGEISNKGNGHSDSSMFGNALVKNSMLYFLIVGRKCSQAVSQSGLY